MAAGNLPHVTKPSKLSHRTIVQTIGCVAIHFVKTTLQRSTGWLCLTLLKFNLNVFFSTDATAPACVQYQISYPGIVYSNYGCSNTNGLFDLYASAAVTGTTTLEGFGSSVSLESSVQVDTEITAVQPQPTTTISSFIAPTETQKTLGEEPTTPILPSSTAQIARGSLATPTWRPENIVILLILQLLFVI